MNWTRALHVIAITLCVVVAPAMPQTGRASEQSAQVAMKKVLGQQVANYELRERTAPASVK